MLTDSHWIPPLCNIVFPSKDALEGLEILCSISSRSGNALAFYKRDAFNAGEAGERRVVIEACLGNLALGNNEVHSARCSREKWPPMQVCSGPTVHVFARSDLAHGSSWTFAWAISIAIYVPPESPRHGSSFFFLHFFSNVNGLLARWRRRLWCGG